MPGRPSRFCLWVKKEPHAHLTSSGEAGPQASDLGWKGPLSKVISLACDIQASTSKRLIWLN